MMTVHEVSKISGVSIRALHHYDNIGLLPATKVTEAGYRLYDEAVLERLQHILLFKELEFPLKDIKEILDSPDFDRSKALEQQIHLLELKKEHLENLIDLARGIKAIGVKPMSFEVFDTGKIDEYARQAKASWGKLYGQWLCEAATFVYDFDRFDAEKILPMFAKYKITTFCAPPTMYRMLAKQDLSRFDLSSIEHASTAGEALNPEVYRQFQKATGLSILEGFGQSESTLIIGNLNGQDHKLGSMGKPVPLYDVHLLDVEGNEVDTGETGEICINIKNGLPCGLAYAYEGNEEVTAETWRDGYYHTGDLAWRDEEGFYWYVGRADDVIKSSGYRIGPFEIENVIMELPYVLECGVSAAPDEVRGQVVKACIVLVKGTEGTEELKKEIQNYVKAHTAPYKYPRIVEFREELPKTISGKIQRNKL